MAIDKGIGECGLVMGMDKPILLHAGLFIHLVLVLEILLVGAGGKDFDNEIGSANTAHFIQFLGIANHTDVPHRCQAGLLYRYPRSAWIWFLEASEHQKEHRIPHIVSLPKS